MFYANFLLIRKNLIVLLIFSAIFFNSLSIARGGQAPESESVVISYGSISVWEGGAGMGSMYFDPINGREQSGDYVGKTAFCSIDSEFICIKGKLLEFAVPRLNMLKIRRWIFNGNTYEIQTRPNTVSPILDSSTDTYHWDLTEIGRDEQVLLINSTAERGGQKVSYLFSHDKGLVGIIYSPIVGGEVYGNRIYWLSGSSGVGSREFERVIKSEYQMNKSMEPEIVTE
ncbi:hypothetical protein OLMES_1591 [Oleiphilus messinensis]|uniref:Uncharacterized protein n=1 Tax=Oleiphilus messinensis TaxID=141451 RepID=A0A1Y0I7B4_9GAMM|nr:hypothetical protein [Oleiphilus messinensis]ARU55666.1 hypothetical protein OLMES_1591 [Oleiphilus messinensis]